MSHDAHMRLIFYHLLQYLSNHSFAKKVSMAIEKLENIFRSMSDGKLPQWNIKFLFSSW